MKKKLVAFAVTAAMIVTSAVPAFADTMGGWTDSTITTPSSPVVEGNPNVIRINEKGFTTTEGVAGTLSETPITFETIVDLNDGPEVFATPTFALNLLNKDNKQATNNIYLTIAKADNIGNSYFQLGNGDGKAVSFTGTAFNGIATLVWTVTEDEVTVEIYNNGEMAKPVGTLTKAMPTDATQTASLTARAATKKTFDMYVEYPTFVEGITVQIDNPEYDEKKAAKLGEDYTVPKYIDATQPVKDVPMYVNGVTLTADTVIAREDVEKYVKIEWYADNTVVGTGLDYTPGQSDMGHKITVKATGLKSDSGIFGEKTWGADTDALARFYRLEGENRYETAMAVADYMNKEIKNGAGFDNFVIASGTNYADALSGVALAKKLQAPILLVNAGSEDAVVEYINKTAKSYGSDVYILGGENAVSASFAEKVKKYDVTRLGGENRYATNIEILKALDLGATNRNTFMVCSGLDYADALSASATGYPVVLVGNTLTKAQKNYLKTLGSNDFYQVIGGTSAVSANVMNTLKSKDYVQNPDVNVVRVAGANRFETSAKVYEKYKDTAFKGATYAFVASGNNYPDGLVVGALAHYYSAPILLVNGNNTGYANKIVKSMSQLGKYSIFVAGGPAAVSDEAIQKIAAKVDAK